MSASLLDSGVQSELDNEITRARKLANAKKKLRSFRAGKSENTSAGLPDFPFSSTSSSPMPLVTDLSSNAPHTPRHSNSFKENQLDLPPFLVDPAPLARSPGKLRKARSKGSMSHRRQASSITFGGNGSTEQGSLMGLFGSEDLEIKPMRARLPRGVPNEINTTSAMPMMNPPFAGEHTEEDREVVKERLTAFTFGSKPPPTSRSPAPKCRIGQPLLPSQNYPVDGFPSPETSPSKYLSTPNSRPPSLLVTRPTPLAFGSPSPTGTQGQLDPPRTPPTPARSKRHSHTRSSSISLPNLKLGSRPTSLGIPASPSFPSSPSSAADPRPVLNNGTRLKFEPSGRGAEAEKEKEEYRRKALEKLTGSPSPVFPDITYHEIALPELDDEDTSSVASSARPFSGSGSFTSGRPLSSTSTTPSGLSWTTSEDSPTVERWFTGCSSKQDNEEDAFGFGFTFSGNGSGSFSLGAIAPAPSLSTYETGLGIGLPSTIPVRPSMTRNLSVLAEVDEPEDGDTEQDTLNTSAQPMLGANEVSNSPFAEESIIAVSEAAPMANLPSRLRELHLVSAASTPPLSRSSTASTPSTLGSPTKGYGAIGRGRPGPPMPIKPESLYPSESKAFTSHETVRKRRGGSRGSSISYKKDADLTPSRDWSISDIASPPSIFSPHYSGLASASRSNVSRPCPRPKSLAGMSYDNNGAGRVLGEVEEVDEDAFSSRNASHRLSSVTGESDRQTSNSRDSFGVFTWRDSQLELEMERDELREDVDLWRKRCAGLEEKLELEKKENGILRDRARKLSDRVSAMASYPATNWDTSLIADLRTQVFGVKAELERERNHHLMTLDRVAELEARLKAAENGPGTVQPFISNVIPPSPLPAENNIENAEPTHEETSADPVSRIRAWGFPRGSVKPSNERGNRDSFFGLSQVLRRNSTEHEALPQLGIDLPPILLSPSENVPSRSVSDPSPLTSAPVAGSLNSEVVRSISLTSSAASAMTFLADYLPKYTPSTSTTSESRSRDYPGEKRLPVSGHVGVIDFSKACKCCVGDVIEI